MRILNSKKNRLLLIFLSICFLLCACQNSSQNSEKNGQTSVTEVSGSLQIEFLDVGKADAILLFTQNSTVLIDCGEKGDGKEILECLDSHQVQSVDYLFITHFDQDHVGGVPKVMKNISIENIVTPKYKGSNEAYVRYAQTLSQLNLSAVELTEEMYFTLDDVSFQVYPPKQTSYEEGDNDYSLAIRAIHGENQFLFAGDAESERLSEFSSQFPLAHNFLKVPHHGRYSQGEEEFLASVSPSYAVITCSKKNPPDEQVLDALENCQVYLTEDGDITVNSDGKTIEINQ